MGGFQKGLHRPSVDRTFWQVGGGSPFIYLKSSDEKWSRRLRRANIFGATKGLKTDGTASQNPKESVSQSVSHPPRVLAPDFFVPTLALPSAAPVPGTRAPYSPVTGEPNRTFTHDFTYLKRLANTHKHTQTKRARAFVTQKNETWNAVMTVSFPSRLVKGVGTHPVRFVLEAHKNRSKKKHRQHHVLGIYLLRPIPCPFLRTNEY